MPRFIAIPVNQGDAFYLETKAGSVLVDGGLKVNGFGELFYRHTKRDGVDVLVATHNDADHANGVLGFLKAGLTCNEVWLPGRWAQLLPHVLRPWEEIVAVLVQQVERIEQERIGVPRFEVSLLEQHAESVSREAESLRSEEDMLELDESGWPRGVVPLLEDASEEDKWWALTWPARWYWDFSPPFRLRYWQPHGRLFLEAIVAAKRIREIALEAYHRGIPVRWFEWNTQSPGGGHGWLVPLNSRQIARVRPVPEEMFLAMLSLTVFNRESLVFWVPEQYSGGGVLFTADSDLNGVNFQPSDGAIVTAPHHGSGENKRVYSTINSRVIWVRSDGKFRKRPCPEYLRVLGKRFCTLCHHPASRKQAVVFWQRGRTWIRGRNVNPCMCVCKA